MSTNISQAFLAELDHEMRTTRRVLERVPGDQLEWQPHPKSMSLGRLATHIAELPRWLAVTIQQGSLDIAPPGGGGYKPVILGSRDEILALFDQNIQEGRAVLAGVSDEELLRPWSLLRGGKTIFTQPKVAVVRSVVFNHIIHHRGQLSVYLRLSGALVPSIYGPSADEDI